MRLTWLEEERQVEVELATPRGAHLGYEGQDPHVLCTGDLPAAGERVITSSRHGQGWKLTCPEGDLLRVSSPLTTHAKPRAAAGAVTPSDISAFL